MARRTFIANPADVASVAAGIAAGCISVPIGATRTPSDVATLPPRNTQQDKMDKA